MNGRVTARLVLQPVRVLRGVEHLQQLSGNPKDTEINANALPTDSTSDRCVGRTPCGCGRPCGVSAR